jgi:hypothetical protein
MLPDRDYRKLEGLDDTPGAVDLPDQWQDRFARLADQASTVFYPISYSGSGS